MFDRQRARSDWLTFRKRPRLSCKRNFVGPINFVGENIVSPTGNSCTAGALMCHRPKINFFELENYRSVCAGDFQKFPKKPDDFGATKVLENIKIAQKFAAVGNGSLLRVTGILAFHRKYFKFFSGERITNLSGNFRGTVVSASFRRYFDQLDDMAKNLRTADAVLKFLDLGIEAGKLSWNDRSAKGIGANSLVAHSRWATDYVLLTIPRMAAGASQLAADGAGKLGYTEAEVDIREFGRFLEDIHIDARASIERVMSVANARDALTWRTSMFNPENYGFLADGFRSGRKEAEEEFKRRFNAARNLALGSDFERKSRSSLKALQATTVDLYNSAAQALGSAFSSAK